MGGVDAFKYLNAKHSDVVWDELPCTFEVLLKAISVIPQVSAMGESLWNVLRAVLHLGNVDFTGQGDDDAIIKSKDESELPIPPLKMRSVHRSESSVVVSVQKAGDLLKCNPEELTKALCTLNIKAGLDWIARPQTTDVARSAVNALGELGIPSLEWRLGCWFPENKVARLIALMHVICSTCSLL